MLSKKLSFNRYKTTILFISSYLLFTFLIVPAIAPLFGRSALTLRGSLRPLTYLTVLLNRHYVKTELKTQLIKASERMQLKFNNTDIKYLDANFPFLKGFPLLPHLSHNDGKKIDLAFFYTDKATGLPTAAHPSPIGYGIYESPNGNEANYSRQCYDQGYYQYSILGRLVPQWKAQAYAVDVNRTKALLDILLAQQTTSKIFIEPHLKMRWGLANQSKVRFHGCKAVRHDDHIHLQIN